MDRIKSSLNMHTYTSVICIVSQKPSCTTHTYSMDTTQIHLCMHASPRCRVCVWPRSWPKRRQCLLSPKEFERCAREYARESSLGSACADVAPQPHLGRRVVDAIGPTSLRPSRYSNNSSGLNLAFISVCFQLVFSIFNFHCAHL